MIYVTVQFACIIWLISQCRISHLEFAHMTVLLIAVMVGIWAVVSMRPENINIAPALKENHRLVTTGIYGYIRHPMYASVILFCAAMLATHLSWMNSLVFVSLLIDLWLKLRHEERLLSERFPDYRDYQRRTKMIIPFIY